MSGSKETRISESTLMPISLIVILAGAIFWAASVGAKVDATAQDIQVEREERKDSYDQVLKEVKEVDRKVTLLLLSSGKKH